MQLCLWLISTECQHWLEGNSSGYDHSVLMVRRGD